MINYLDIIIVVSSSFTAAILLIILLYHAVIYFQEKKYERLKENWESIIIQYLEGRISLDDASFLLGDEYMYLKKLFDFYLKKLDGIYFQHLKLLSDEIGMTEYFLKKINSRRKKLAINAIAFIGRLKEERAILYLQKRLNSSDEEIMITSIWAIASIGETDLLVPVLKSIFSRTHMTFEGITELMIHFGDKICQPLRDMIEEDNKGEKRLSHLFEIDEYMILSLLIDILGYHKDLQAIPVIRQLLVPQQDTEVLIHIFKAFSRIGVIVENDLQPYILHIDWVVRSQAVRYIGIIKDRRYINDLKYLLMDRKWWVRYYAADTLFRLGEVDLLIDIARSNTSPADICIYVLSQNKKLLETQVGEISGYTI
ncbi:MAG: HEAT repeat domain-containing protein [Halanaerobiales bacterium]